MRARKAEMDDRADAFVVLPGGIGTLEEFFEVWTAATLGMHAKPVVVLDPEGFYEPLWAWLRDLSVRGFVRPAPWTPCCTPVPVEQAPGRRGDRPPGPEPGSWAGPRLGRAGPGPGRA
jgi:hypothetical protein